jgi:hypothetical protein
MLLDGEITYVSVGQLSPDDSTAPDENTLYEVGSISKPLVGIAIASLVEEGALELDAPVDPGRRSVHDGGPDDGSRRVYGSRPPLPGRPRPVARRAGSARGQR